MKINATLGKKNTDNVGTIISQRNAKAMVADLRRYDLATFTAAEEQRRIVADTLLQRGDRVGKRVKGATDHTFEAQAKALQFIVDNAGVPEFTE